MPTCAPGERANVIEADAFKRIKHHNFTGLITLLTYIITYLPYCYRIIASGRMGGIKTKFTGSPVFFFSPRQHSARDNQPIFLVVCYRHPTKY